MIAIWLNLLALCAISFFAFKKISQEPLKKYFLPGLILKYLAGISVGLVYTYYYKSGDTFIFYHDALIYNELAFQSPIKYIKSFLTNEIPDPLYGILQYSGQPRALLTSKILSIFTLLTNGNYWLSGMYFSLFSYLGMWYLANEIAKKYPSTKFAAAFGFLFFPSVVFWSSGILKESLIMGALSFLAGFIIANLPTFKNRSWLNLIWISIMLLLLWQLKYYYLAVFLSVFITLIIISIIFKKFPQLFRNLIGYYILWILIFMLILGASTSLYPTLSIENFLFFLLDTHNAIYQKSSPENLVHYYNLSASFSSLLINFPIALFAGLFRPGLWDINSLIGILPSLESTYILISAFFALKSIKNKIAFPDKMILFSLLVYILLLAVLMAFASPNFGTLIRYKIGYLPFIIYLVSIDNPLLKLFKKVGT
ncbi:MAG: hypothetical protein M3512_13215 [Bacteroidota bacterium]|nr:hypothetical protein [Bacteroidota bacterium]